MIRAFAVLLICFILTAPAACQEKSHFDLGMEDFTKGNYSISVKEFEAAVKDDPENMSIRFYYALSLYYDDKLTEARDEFKKVYVSDKTSPWGLSARSYIEMIDLDFLAPRPEDDYDGYLGLSYDSDDNITYGPALVAEGGDHRYSSQVSLTYKPVLFSFRPFSFSIGGYSSMYDKLTQYNNYGGNASVSLNGPFLFDGYSTLMYGYGDFYQHYDPYYSSDYTEARVTFNTIKNSPQWTSIYIGGTSNLYKSSTYEAFDGYNTTVGIKQDLNPLMYLQYENKCSLTRGLDYANRSDEYAIGASAPFPYYYKLLFLIKYMNKYYLNEDSIGNLIRHDTSWVFDFFFSKDIIRGLTVGARYVFTNYISNLNKTGSALGYGSYNDHVLSLSISYSF